MSSTTCRSTLCRQSVRLLSNSSKSHYALLPWFLHNPVYLSIFAINCILGFRSLKRLESLTEAEVEALLEQVEEEKRRMASGEQVK